jgi:NAD(P)-dependent dehydrogenase (short-subunit alcohol dehydrogenase family)
MTPTASPPAGTGAVLVTGCSSGIGRATALRLARRGHLVYATARRPEAIADLADAGCRVLGLDVTDEQSMRAAVAAVEAAHGQVGVLVNNAGWGQYGAVEEVDLDDVRRQFETNVFGLARMCQLVLPAMRAARRGRIVNVSSMGGRLTFPGGGYYHASKHAVEALSDALRFEVAGFGVRVCVVEPGLIRTRFGETAHETHPDGSGPYAGFTAASQAAIASSYRTPLAAGPEAVAKAVERAATARHPRTRYRVTLGARLMLTTRRLLPDVAWDAAMATTFPRPGKA